MRKLKNILVTGCNGQIGYEVSQLCSQYPWFNFILTNKNTLDITSPDDVKRIFTQYKFDTVINCSAYTAVDKAESEPELANAVNARAIQLLIEYCDFHEANLFHLSTDFVFDGAGNSPYREDAPTNPINVYGKSKLDGEKIALTYPRTFIFRTSWVYSSHGNNFVKTILRLAREKSELRVVNDQIGSPTYAADIADTLLRIATTANHIQQAEIFNYANEGIVSWFDFANKILQLKNINIPIFPIASSEYPTPAKRPSYSVLDSSKIRSRFNLSIPGWQQSLSRCLSKL